MSLVFKYGCMNAAKTMQLLAFRHGLLELGVPVVLIKPKVDTRYPHPIVGSRSGLQAAADILLDYHDLTALPATLDELLDLGDNNFILVDEAQFVSPEHIRYFRSLVDTSGCHVVCYGLKSDFRASLFPGSQELLILADSIECIESYCMLCRINKAMFNARLDSDGFITRDGPQVAIEGEYTYMSVCSKCFGCG